MNIVEMSPVRMSVSMSMAPLELMIHFNSNDTVSKAEAMEYAKNVLDGYKVRGKDIVCFPSEALLNIGLIKTLGPIEFSADVVTVGKVLRANSESRQKSVKTHRDLFQTEGELSMDYVVKGPFQPLRHQISMYNAMNETTCCAILSEAGTCKTASYLWCIDNRIARGLISKAIVITLAGLKKNVVAEAKMQTPGLRCIAVDGTEHMAKTISKLNEYDVVITNYEAIRHLPKILTSQVVGSFGMIVLDEAHRVGSHDSAQTEEIMKMFSDVPYRYIVTGSLVSNNEMSFYMPYRFLGADIVPVSRYEQFRRTYMITVDPNQRIWKPLPGTATLVRKLIADVGIGFKKDACLDLPGIVEISRTCSMDTEQKKADKQLIKELVTVVEDMCQQCSGSNFGYMDCNRGCGNAIMIDHALVLIGKRRQIASGFYIQTMVKLNGEGKEVNDSQVVKIGKNPKLKLLGDYLDEIPFDEKVIVWTHWVWTIKEIETYLKARKDGGVVVCYGDIDAFDAVEQFKLPGIKYFLAMPSKAGVGLNIQFSSYQVWFSNHYSWIQYDQAIARQDRQGQKNKVTVCHLVCEGSADEDVLAVLKHKRELSISLGSGAVIWKQFLKK